MTALSRSVISAVSGEVDIVYLDRATSKWWNQRRRRDDTATFCGWYWIKGRDEMGPFKTRSACVRDAYYRFVLKREIPNVGHSQLTGVSRLRVSPKDIGKDAAAVSMGKRGGTARAAALTPERRADISRKGAAKRWSGR